MAQWDHAWKSSVRCLFYPMMRFLFPKIAAKIDESAPLEFLDKEIRPAIAKGHKTQTAPSRGALFVDMLVRVTLRSGNKQTLLIHIEFQNQEDHDFERRIFQYYMGLTRSFGEDILSLAILGDTNSEWKPRAYRRNLLGNKLVYGFQTAKLWDYHDQLEALVNNPNPFALMVAAHLITHQTQGRSQAQQRAAWKTRVIRLALKKKISHEDIVVMMEFVDGLLTLPTQLDNEVWEDVELNMTEEERMKYTGFLGIATKKAVEAATIVLLAKAAQEKAEALEAAAREKEELAAAAAREKEALAAAAAAREKEALAAAAREKEALAAAAAREKEALAAATREKREILQSYAQSKFGTLPESIVTLIQTAPPDRLHQWTMNLLDKNTLDEVFAT